MIKLRLLPLSLPEKLLNNFKLWKKREFKKNKELFSKLDKNGQKPHSLLIQCCDSRVDILPLFNAEPGEFFVDRNIAGLVPKYSKNKKIFCSSTATLEYAVCFLKVKNIIIVGHSNCGGVKMYFDGLKNKIKGIDEKYKGLKNWLNNFGPLNNLIKIDKLSIDYEYLEKETVLLSMKNILTYSFVKDAEKRQALNIYALWYNFKKGELEFYNSSNKKFEKI